MRRLRAEVEPLEALPFRGSVRNKARQKTARIVEMVQERISQRRDILDSVKRLMQE